MFFLPSLYACCWYDFRIEVDMSAKSSGLPDAGGRTISVSDISMYSTI